MNIALLGYGKMGQAIEAYCNNNTDHKISLKIDENNQEELTVENIAKADVAIDFSLPEIATKHIRLCFEADTPVVSGTTGWLSDFDKIIAECKEKNQTFFYSSNYSVGVNLFWQIVEKASALLNAQVNFTTKVDEIHHIHKKDAPSGTAITTAEIILKNNTKYTNWKLGNTSDTNELPIFAHRQNEVPGTHTVTFDSDIDTIKIEHIAKSRQGFVQGAVHAAEFIQNKKGVYSMNDLLLKLEA